MSAGEPAQRAKKLKTLESSEASERKKQHVQAWGKSKSHLELVRISLEEPIRTNCTILDKYVNLSYINKLDGQEEEIVNCGIIYHPATNLNSHTQDVDVSCLQSLKADVEYMKYLKYFISEQTAEWDIAPSAPETPPSLLSKFLIQAFLYNMTDAVGKEAMRQLLQQIISKLGLEQNLLVMQTGSASGVSFLSTLVEVDTWVECTSASSSSSSSSSSGDSSPGMNRNFLFSVVVPTCTHGPRCKNIEPSSVEISSAVASRSPPKKKKKLTTSDVIVFPQFTKNKITEPIASKLVVSVKGGKEKSNYCLPTELMSRLPYQSGRIFGLHINALEGQLFSVSREKDCVNIFSYTPHRFRRTVDHFDHEAFFSLILDLGKVLLSDP